MDNLELAIKVIKFEVLSSDIQNDEEYERVCELIDIIIDLEQLRRG